MAKLKTRAEIVDAISNLKAFDAYSEKTGERAAEVVEQAERVCTEQAPAAFQNGYNARLIYRVAAHMVRHNEPASRAYLFC